MPPKIITIGVYGWREAAFFGALTAARVDVFCDIRLRRGLRGPLYAFANSSYLQQRLTELKIGYVHDLALAPTAAIREYQAVDDKRTHTARRKRTELSDAFISAYERERLTGFDADQFVRMVGPTAHVIGLFCVEQLPEACHRSLVAERLARAGFAVEHLLPPSDA